MTKDQLLNIISKPLSKARVKELAAVTMRNDTFIQDVIDLSFCPQREMAFRAAWILEHIQTDHSNQFLPFAKSFLLRYSEQNNISCQRHYTKIMMNLFQLTKNSDTAANILEKHNFQPIVETTFEWLINPETPVAVQVNCMDILFSMKERYPWIAEELKDQIEFMLRNGSAAVQSRGRHILKRLK